MTKFYVDGAGNYLGGFDGAKPPAGAIEIQEPPKHGTDKWDGAKWVASAGRTNAELKAQIAALEVKQHRAVREAALGMVGATARIVAIENEIIALRAQLK